MITRPALSPNPTDRSITILWDPTSCPPLQTTCTTLPCTTSHLLRPSPNPPRQHFPSSGTLSSGPWLLPAPSVLRETPSPQPLPPRPPWLPTALPGLRPGAPSSAHPSQPRPLAAALGACPRPAPRLLEPASGPRLHSPLSPASASSFPLPTPDASDSSSRPQLPERALPRGTQGARTPMFT